MKGYQLQASLSPLLTQTKNMKPKESSLIVYKASALKSYLAGLSANSYIITLSNHKEEWANISRNLDSTYLGREFFIEEEKWLHECNKIIKYSNDR
jgi:hypothetical protein